MQRGPISPVSPIRTRQHEANNLPAEYHLDCSHHDCGEVLNFRELFGFLAAHAHVIEAPAIGPKQKFCGPSDRSQIEAGYCELN